MASKCVSTLTLKKLILRSDTGAEQYTLFVHQGVVDRCQTDHVLSDMLFNKLQQDHPLGTSGQKTLSSLESVRLLSRMGLLVDVLPTKESTAVSDTISSSLVEEDSHTPIHSPTPSEEDSADNFFWSHEAVLLLVDLKQKCAGYFNSSTISQKQAWKKVAEQMGEKGYSCSADDCDKKFRGMKMRYKIIKERNSRTGNNRKSWRYYSIMEELYRGDPAVMPVASVSSLPKVQADFNQENLDPVSASYTVGEEREDKDDVVDRDTRENQATAPLNRKRKTHNVEPAWMAEYRSELKSMHNEKMKIDKERMELERRRVCAIERLVTFMENSKE